MIVKTMLRNSVDRRRKEVAHHQNEHLKVSLAAKISEDPEKVRANSFLGLILGSRCHITRFRKQPGRFR